MTIKSFESETPRMKQEENNIHLELRVCQSEENSQLDESTCKNLDFQQLVVKKTTSH